MRTRRNRKDGSELIQVSAGDFLMGSLPGRGAASEVPQRTIYLEEFWIARIPVTVSQYLHHCKALGRPRPPEPGWGWEEDHPVVNVSFADALSYCEWAGLQLPTEAQWERAARGTDGRQFPWGNEWDSTLCNSLESGSGRTTQVGSYPKGDSPAGCHDMAGNVWEWCADWYDASYYRRGSSWNPRGPGSGLRRSLRGGSWKDAKERVRTAFRGFLRPEVGQDSVGFRCVAVLLE